MAIRGMLCPPMARKTLIDPILTAEAAWILRVSAATVRDWERKGILSAVKTLRGTRVFDRPDVERVARELQARRAAGLVSESTLEANAR
jgi:DNA-binding transcriptional MerR regulator